MTRHPFDIEYDALPDEIPIFPLTGALLLPGGRLPLNIFEPRYLNLVDDALAGGRLMAMVQPRLAPADGEAEIESPSGSDVPVYPIGCLGRIAAFQETDDGRMGIDLRGMIRFSIGEELPVKDGYRRARPEFDAYRDDLVEPRDVISPAMEPHSGEAGTWVDRARMLGSVKSYFEAQEVTADWRMIEGTPDEVLVTTLAMVCPLAPIDRQALLESPNTGLRAKLLIALLEAALTGEETDAPLRH